MNGLKERYPERYVIVSPPRCSSTALARVFWEHAAIGYYAHEPFETLYYQGQTVEDVIARMMSALDLTPLKKNRAEHAGSGLIIKEMPYQVGRHFPLLVDLATAPIVFLIRDPRLNISSRMKRKVEVGDSPIFPLIETGWQLIASQIDYCQERSIPHVVIDSSEFRNHPMPVLGDLFPRLGLAFSEEMLSWEPQSDFDIDNLDGSHTHLYQKVLRSSGLMPDDEPIPPLDSFPHEGGFFRHASECMEIYSQLRAMARQLVPA